jgi:hypothetical protein
MLATSSSFLVTERKGLRSHNPGPELQGRNIKSRLIDDMVTH